MTRVATLASHEMSLALIQSAQGRIQENQLQIGSGKKAQRFDGIARDAGLVVNLEASHKQTQQFISNNDRIDQRLQTMETNVASVFDVAMNFRVLLVNALNEFTLDQVNLNQQAKDLLAQVSGLLNQKEDGRYLFAGSMTGTQPVDITALPANGVFGLAASTYYYQGDSMKLTLRADDDVDIEYGVTADESGFSDLIQALQIAATTDVTNATSARVRLDDALRLTNLAVDSVPDIRSGIGSARANLESLNEKHRDFLLYTEQSIGDMENVDITKAVTRMTGDQTLLEASFAALARVRSISLLQFLN